MRKFLFYFLSFILVLLVGLWLVLHSEIFWRWTGPKIIHSLNDRLQGELTVANIEGTPFNGWVFKGVKLITPKGEIFHAKAFTLQVSLWSILQLNPVIEKVALYNPVLTLERNKQGQWNTSGLYKPQGRFLEYFNSLNFSHIMIDHGQVEVQQPGGTKMFKDINLNAGLQVFRPATPLQRLELEKLLLSADTPWGPYNLKTDLVLR